MLSLWSLCWNYCSLYLCKTSTKRILCNCRHSYYCSYHQLIQIGSLPLFSPKPSLKRLFWLRILTRITTTTTQTSSSWFKFQNSRSWLRILFSSHLLSSDCNLMIHFLVISYNFHLLLCQCIIRSVPHSPQHQEPLKLLNPVWKNWLEYLCSTAIKVFTLALSTIAIHLLCLFAFLLGC